METIEEQSKSETSNSSSPSPEHLRICLVGDAIHDAAIVEAAHTFGVPVITSETGLEIINDYDWRTFFILLDFEGPVYEAIHKSKQCILGPPALKHAAAKKDGLMRNARPLFNYSMRGVVTCFTGIRKKDELTRLVNLIHSMGGCIRKDMNSKITHLISNHSGGDKYQYAKTFRLTVVRPAWVYAAWERRDDLEFRTTTEEFSKEYKLKAFEGQKICFFGFPSDEQQHMVDVLTINGGVPAELDDPECSHVVMPNSGGYFPETLTNTVNTASIPSAQATNTTSNSIKMELDTEAAAEAMCVENVENANIPVDKVFGFFGVVGVEREDEAEFDDDSDHFDARLVVDYECNRVGAECEDGISPLLDELDEDDNVAELNTNASTPKRTEGKPTVEQENRNHIDGIVLSNDEANVFQPASNISPILSTPRTTKFTVPEMPIQISKIKPADSDVTAMEIDDLGLDDEEDGQFMLDELKDLKRKRESFDSVSLASVDSFVLPNSTKKPKLTRTGSITRSIKRSMSFTPIVKMLRSRRSSVALDGAPNFGDAVSADDSICSIASTDTTFNESIRKPVKEKLRSIRERITRSSSKKEKSTMNILKTPEKITTANGEQSNADADFKTPKAPPKLSSSAAAKANTPKSSKKSTTQFQSTLKNSLGIVDTLHTISATTTTATSFDTTTTATSFDTCHLINRPTTNTSTSSLATTSAYTSHPTCNQDHANAIATKNVTNAAAHSMQYEDECTTKCNNLQNAAGNSKTVVDEHATQAKPEPKNNRTHILKSDWFWYTIQNGYADEMDYLFGDYLDSIANTPNTDRRDSLPISFNKRKRKRFSQRLQLEGTPLGSGKRRSSVSDAGLLSVSGSFFDCTTSPDKLESVKLHNEPDTPTIEQTPVKKSMRFNHFMDFFSTESNYVGILDTIVNLFKNPLEEIAECSDALLNKSEIKAIFGNFLPIHEVHQSMLESLRNIHGKWSEECLIGDIILQHRNDLIKAYPPYVNFFEQMKETLQQADVQNPRFHAFLKINQTKPECGRQSLTDLMIRPVQRLPSISLLLNDILKHTNKNNPDYARLEEALKAIKEVMMHINEDKRKTESRMAIFDIFNDIEGCPPHLVSSNRSFISKCEVTELSENMSGRGDSLVLYLFSDTIEVCKKRSRGFNSAKSPSNSKSHKHLKLMSLNAIRFVIDITDSPRAFALLCRQDKDKLHCFTIIDEEIDKLMYLKTVCKQMAENACRTDTDKALLSRTSQELEVDISDVNLSTLSKAFKLAARTRLKVGRAFSFNKTPSKLKRAVSTMMTSPFGSTNSLTPASQLAQMRLASCTNIHEAVDEDGSRSSSPSTQSEVLLPPLSVQTPRKNKTSTLTSMVGRI